MIPTQYRFSINGRLVKPIYKSDLSVDYEMESNQQFFMKKLSGKISFVREDFDLLNSQGFNTEFILLIQQSADNGKTWTQLFQGKFMKTDCTWDNDNRKVEVQPETYDEYNDVIAGLDKEYNIIPLCPETESVTIMKRPLIQVYIPGQDVVSCFLSGTYWEQEVAESNDDIYELRDTYHFGDATRPVEVQVTAEGNAPDTYNGLYTGRITRNENGSRGDFYANGKNVHIRYEEAGFGNLVTIGMWYAINASGEGEYIAMSGVISSGTVTLEAANPLEGEDKGSLTLDVVYRPVMMRYLLDVNSIGGLSTYPIPTEDILSDNRNYRRCIDYPYDLAVVSSNFSEEPTEYGKADNGMYYMPPSSILGEKYYPIARSTWGNTSLWFAFYLFDSVTEVEGRKAFVLKDAYRLSSVINALLEQFSDIRHEATAECSQFLYGSTNPISNQKFTLLITQKSNVLHGEYDQPAQKAETTLGTMLNALRDIYRCYWYIENGKLKIEHISFFRNGGSYSGASVGVDLTQIKSPNNGKTWGYLTSNYEFDKSDMAERYQFSWMDDVTETFDGKPIEIRSKYVTAGKIEEITVSSITTDIDYMLLNPSAISEDGFALFAAVGSSGNYSLPFVERNIDGADLTFQNGYLSWITLQPNYYVYDLPAKAVTINDTDMTMSQTSRQRKQKVKFPSATELDVQKLVKTYLGNGQVEKITLNLCSRINEVTLKYDTEQ